MIQQKEEHRRRASAPYGSYARQSQRKMGTGGVLGLQTGVCAVLLLCLLAGWVSNAAWFQLSKQQLLAQFGAEDQTAQVGLMISGMLPKKSDQDKSSGTKASESQSSQQPSDQELSQAQENTKQKLEELYEYIDRYGKEASQSAASSSGTGLTGMGGYQPVSLENAQRYAAPEGNLLSPLLVTAKPLLPVKQATVTSNYGYRIHPITGELDFHTGIDLAAPLGTSIASAWPGTVSEVGWSDIYGNYAIVSHSGGLATFYAHCDSIVVTQGMVLRQGERIGFVGSTGLSTGPHLHWEIRLNGMRTDPAWALFARKSDRGGEASA